jgi:inner membrane protein
MDPITQGALGISAAQSCSRPKQLAWAGLFGLLGGLAPDLDVLIRSDTDPLLFLMYHRQFSHSLIFIPLGGLLLGLLLHGLFGRRQGFSLPQTVLFTTLGYATHALLDACTTYGTQLLWPFSEQRFAWNNMSIIDPLYSLVVIGLVVTAALKKKPWLARLALAWVVAYPLAGAWQRERVEAEAWQLVKQRGHQPIRLEAKPSFANLWVWKVVYETDQRFYVDAIRMTTSALIYEGDSLEKLDVERDFPWLDKDSQQAKDIERFRWFSNGYIAKDPDRPNHIIDVRYSMVPNEIEALWGIQVRPTAALSEHSVYVVERSASRRHRQALTDMLLGR